MDNQLFVMLMAGGEGGGDMTMFVFLGLMFVVMYFFMIRPQSKKAKEQRNFLENIEKGQKVVTIGGIHGKVLSVGDNTLMIEVDSSTKLKVEKSSVSIDFTKALNADDKK